MAIAVVSTLVFNANRWRFIHAGNVVPIFIFEEVARLNFLLVDGWRDRCILAFEGWLFAEPPTVWLGRFASPVVTEILAVGDSSYYLILAIVGGVLYRRPDQAPFFGVMAASVLSYMLSYAAFIVFPTEGPAHTLRHLHTESFTGGPFYWTVIAIQSNAGVHGNAFPSAHAAGAVAALIFAWRYVPKLAVWLTPLVALLCIGGVYLRYHYAADMLAGILTGAVAATCVMLLQLRR